MRSPSPRRHAWIRAREVFASRAARRTERPSTKPPTASITKSTAWVLPGNTSHGRTRSRPWHEVHRASHTSICFSAVRVRSQRWTRVALSSSACPPQRAQTHPDSAALPLLATNAP